MSVIQPALVIPPEFEAKLLSHELVRIGGVLRDAAGKIRCILQDGPIPVKEVSVSRQIQVVNKLNLTKLLKKHKGVAIVGGIGLAVLVGTAIYFHIEKNKSNIEPKVPKSITDFHNALITYLEAAVNGKLDVNVLSCLISSVDEVEKDSSGGKIDIDFSTGELNTLVNCIFDHTIKLAEANSFELDDLDTSCSSVDNTLINLHCHLEAQKSIFKNTAS